MQSQAFETLKEKLNELEINLQREKNAFIEAQVVKKNYLILKEFKKFYIERTYANSK